MRYEAREGLMTPSKVSRKIAEKLEENGYEARAAGSNHRQKVVHVGNEDIFVTLSESKVYIDIPNSVSKEVKQIVMAFTRKLVDDDPNGDNRDKDEMSPMERQRSVDRNGEDIPTVGVLGEEVATIHIYEDDDVKVEYKGEMQERFPLDIIVALAPEYYPEEIPIAVTADGGNITDYKIDRLESALREIVRKNR